MLNFNKFYFIEHVISMSSLIVDNTKLKFTTFKEIANRDHLQKACIQFNVLALNALNKPKKMF